MPRTANCSSVTFRARAGAAPLKRTDDGLYHCDCGDIPRPRGRGPVEATVETSTPTALIAIPRPRGRGPVEATLLPANPLFIFRIPRPRGRGPVEAN